MLGAETDIVTVSKALGHANVHITLTTYAHAIPRERQGAGDALARLMGQSGNKMETLTPKTGFEVGQNIRQVIELNDIGEVAERLNAPVLKTGKSARISGVRISPSPPIKTMTYEILESGHKSQMVHVVVQLVLDALKKIRGVGLKRVFVQSDGEPVNKSRLRVQWLKVRAAAKLEDFKWHDLRHSCASLLAQGGSSLPEIGHVLGHSSPSITAKYSHLIAGAPVTGSAALAAKILAAKL